MQKNKIGEKIGVFGCHGSGGSQMWVSFTGTDIRNANKHNYCISHDLKLSTCGESKKTIQWEINSETGIIKVKNGENDCLSISENNQLNLETCNDEAVNQKWKFEKYNY